MSVWRWGQMDQPISLPFCGACIPKEGSLGRLQLRRWIGWHVGAALDGLHLYHKPTPRPSRCSWTQAVPFWTFFLPIRGKMFFQSANSDPWMVHIWVSTYSSGNLKVRCSCSSFTILAKICTVVEFLHLLNPFWRAAICHQIVEIVPSVDN